MSYLTSVDHGAIEADSTHRPVLVSEASIVATEKARASFRKSRPAQSPRKNASMRTHVAEKAQGALSTEVYAYISTSLISVHSISSL